ncbi:MAG TPA: tetraacyldisaccharide 4'-kinase [Deltaproteobacteria bacterium]|nr:tetraacyldisaccharide 4'-kinase [Deltaproteobacteria bacterium]
MRRGREQAEIGEAMAGQARRLRWKKRFAEVVRDWMNRERIPAPAHALLYGLSLGYGAAVAARSALYERGVFRSRSLDCRVVSVGNLTVGGTGKTPVTMYVASRLRRMGRRVAILSRGYGGSVKETAVVSDGSAVLLGPAEAGDEPCLMARRLEGVPVLVGPERLRTGERAVREFSADVVVLDDGFQHLALRRDLDILLVDGRRGLGNGHLLPRGLLREPPQAAVRAGLVMVKEPRGGERPPFLPARLRAPVVGFHYRPASLREVHGGGRLDTAALRGARVAALCALADPDSFVRTLEELGAAVSSRLFYPDHHAYTPADMERIAAASRGADLCVTTEKDAVKLAQLDPRDSAIHALAVDVVVDDEETLDKTLSTVAL